MDIYLYINTNVGNETFEKLISAKCFPPPPPNCPSSPRVPINPMLPVWRYMHLQYYFRIHNEFRHMFKRPCKLFLNFQLKLKLNRIFAPLNCIHVIIQMN